jgi:hypothetical protein
MEPDRIVIKTGDPRITKPDGSTPGNLGIGIV